MDFSLLASDNNLNAAAFSLQNDAGKHKGYGFGFLKQDRAINEEEEELREFKMAKTTSSCGEGALSLRSNGCNPFQEGHHQMLSFSSPNSLPLPFYRYPSTAFPRSAGNNGGSMGVRGPFTPSQWMELEHQALIYKYITANVPIPSYLVNPIRKAFHSAGFSAFRSNPLGWSGFQLGFSNSDPEPGRCRRTDGKKWRCSRDAVVDQKYCERHMNRGRHRSRKPVEGQQQTGPSKPTPAPSPSPSTTITRSTPSSLLEAKDERRNSAQEPGRQEFGLVCSDSLLNPLNRGSSLRQFMDEWPKNRPDRSAVSWDGAELQPDRTQLSISIPMDFMSSTSSPTNEKLAAAHSSSLPRELEMGLGVGSLNLDRGQRQSNWVPISWEPSSIGGPLGEVLHKPSNETKQLNLIEKRDNNNSNSTRLTSSPTGVLQRGAFASLSNSSASSPRPESNGLINPSLPTL